MKGRKKYWVESVHYFRAALYFAFFLYVMIFNPSLKSSIFVLFVLSIIAAVEGALSVGGARRAERKSMENPPSEED